MSDSGITLLIIGLALILSAGRHPRPPTESPSARAGQLIQTAQAPVPG